MKAASACFAKYGYAKTTLEDIGKGASLNKASLYYYYKNKESIFTDVILSESETHIAALQRKISKESNYIEKIITYFNERFNYDEQIMNLHQLPVQALKEVEPIFDTLYSKVLEQEVKFLESVLQEGAKKKHFSTSNHHRIARSLLTIADSVRFKADHQSGNTGISPTDFSTATDDIEFIARLILNGIQK